MKRIAPVVVAFVIPVAACAQGPSRDAELYRGPPPTPIGQELWAVDAASANDAWAVGSSYVDGTELSRSVILHWDGGGWSRVASPDVGFLTDVVAVSSDEAWAIGGEKILHWEGSAWTISPHPAPRDSYLTAVHASGPDDAWVVGTQHGAKWKGEHGDRHLGSDTLTMHWDGSRWEFVPSPNPTRRNNRLESVVAISPTNALAVGSADDDSRDPRNTTLALYWDGSTWRMVPSPNPGTDFNVLWGMGTDGAEGPWAVGHYGHPDLDIMALYLRWTGRAWQQVDGPPGEALHQTPEALSGVSADDVWAVGSEPTSSLLIAHWDGTEWSALDVGIQTLGPASGQLSDVVAVTPADAWAVGRYSHHNQVKPWGPTEVFALIEHWDGSTWHLVDAPPPPQ